MPRVAGLGNAISGERRGISPSRREESDATGLDGLRQNLVDDFAVDIG
jgi:hypothetical protein